MIRPGLIEAVPGTKLGTANGGTRSEHPSTASLKILVWSYSFHPKIGGIETMTEILGREFAALGHRVTVITLTPASTSAPESFPFRVVRAPSRLQLLSLVAGCDVFLHNHLSLRVAFPLLFFRRPWRLWCIKPGIALRDCAACYGR